MSSSFSSNLGSDEDLARRLESELEEIENFRFSDDGEDSDASTSGQGLEYPSRIPEHYLGSLRRGFAIPENILLRIPEEGERADNPPEGWVTLYFKMFEYGLRLPLHPFVQEFLFRTGLAPAQVAPNGWGVIFALAILFWLRARDSEEAELLDVDQLLACFEAKRIAKKPGRFYMCARKGAGGIVKGPTSIKGWVRKWFYASGEWLAKDESGRSFFDVPTRFGNLGTE